MFETVIGLEIHAELNTRSKIFCSCSTEFGSKPNENTCPICTGLPGTLPVLNEEVVRLAVRAGKALHCEINMVNKLDRKNYFYPDLPKAYQISQYDLPICENGYIDIETGQEDAGEQRSKRIRITRIHMEEDAGKLIHLEDEPLTLVDYNRTGIPLIEIVTEPDMRSPEEAAAFLKTLKSILEYTEVSDCRMEQGSLRCDVNISIRKAGQKELGTKVEIKNLNSFKEIQKALEKEEKRQKELYQFGEVNKIIQETRKWDSSKGKTVTMRSKEDAHDYRYFPEPDLLPVILDSMTIQEIEDHLPELPEQKKDRFFSQYGLSKYETDILVGDKALAGYFEEVVSFGIDPKDAANWILVELLRVLKDTDAYEIPVKSEYLAGLIKMVEAGKISRNAAKEVFNEMVATDKAPEGIFKEKGLAQISGADEIEKIIREVLSLNGDAVQDYKLGNTKVIGFLMGQIMKASRGKANPNTARDLLESILTCLQ
jgi:aspartyl-tRNA(Asn)/glutamyl-tRNA(Gln) amidotransferase subunit B